jgi:uncharacterized protein (DUF433 family)
MYAGGAPLAHVLKRSQHLTQHKSDMQHSSPKPLPEPLILVSPDVMSGVPVFNGTRVPVQALLDHMEAGKPLDEFLRDFQAVCREHAIAVLDETPRPPVDPDFVPDPLIMISPGMLSGEPVFNRTRVPIQALFDYIEEGDSLDEFLEDFPDVSRAHAIAVLEFAHKSAVVQSSVAMAAE